jgi:hypothetical protein
LIVPFALDCAELVASASAFALCVCAADALWL